MNQALEAIYNRRSIRKYKSEQISREELEAVLKAGVCAPTGMNLQSPIILVLQDKEQIAYLSKLNAAVNHWESDPFYGCLLYTSPSPRDRQKSRMPSSA